MTTQQGSTQFQVVPPMGTRTPLGGGPSLPLAPQAAPPPLGGAPVPPVQPAWAQPAAQPPAQPAAQPIVFRDAAGTDVTEQVTAAILYGAPAAEIQLYYPAASLVNLREFCRQNSYPLNENPTAPPVVLAAPGAPVASEKRKRLNKADDIPRIEQLLREGKGALEISDVIGLQLKSVEKAIKALPSTVTPGPSTPAEELRADGTDGTALEGEGEALADAVPGFASRPMTRAAHVIAAVLVFAREQDISLEEIRLVAELLPVLRA